MWHESYSLGPSYLQQEVCNKDTDYWEDKVLRQCHFCNCSSPSCHPWPEGHQSGNIHHSLVLDIWGLDSRTIFQTLSFILK